MSKNTLVVIIGPTASGKSSLAVYLAKKIGGEIVSADSRQIYRGLDIGSGKISKKEMGGIPHHMLDVADPRRIFSVVEYEQRARGAIRDIIARKNVPIIVGGSGMYIDAVLFGAPYPAVPPNTALRKKLETLPLHTLFLMLTKKDHRRARSIDRTNKRRLIRALEIIAATGAPIPQLKKRSRYNALIIGIRRESKNLRRAIKRRLTKRIKEGLIAEVRHLHKRGVTWKRLGELGLEYRFVSGHLSGAYGKEEMTRTLLSAVVKYAKRQMTWFRQYPEAHWIRDKKQALRRVKKFLNR